jgi:rhodanese-related sulfurtransferase
MSKRVFSLIVAAALLASGPLLADTVKGRIKDISKKAGTIQLDVKGKDPVVVKFGKGTKFVEAAGIEDLGPPDLIKVEYEPGKPATSITKVVFGLPPGVEIDIHQLLAILTGDQPYALFDARPAGPYLAGHVPSARHAFPDDENFLSLLPQDKDQLLVFYCGGPTCPFTGKAVEIAMANGYTNIKGFQAGMPGWSKAKLPVHSSPEWVETILDPHHVVLDVRGLEASGASHIPTAVAMPTAELQALRQQFIQEQRKAELPGVKDKRAQIVLYADTHTDQNLLLAYKELREWGYGKTTLLAGGLEQWKADDRPTESGSAPRQITYVKKLAPGAIPVEEFTALTESPEGVTFLDVRTDEEVASGVLKGAVHVSLDSLDDNLDKLPKDQEIIAYCANGIRAEMAYQKLKGLGYNVRYLNEEITIDKDGDYKL